MPFFTYQVVNVTEETQENKYPGKLTKITLVEIPYQNMLKVRDTKMNNLIWFDEPEQELENEQPEKKDSESEDSESEDDLLNDDEEDNKLSQHQNNRDVLAKIVKKKFEEDENLVTFKFITNKDETI